MVNSKKVTRMAKITIEELYRGKEYIKTKFELMQVLNAVEVKNG